MRYLNDFDSLSSTQQTTSLRSLFESGEINNLIHPDILKQQQTPNNISDYPANNKRLDFALRSQYQSWLPDWSLIRQDKNTMAHSVEYRAFLDHHIIDFAFDLPDDYKIRHRQDKFIWRQLAERHLPRAVTSRPKQPFYLPLETPAWREPLIEMAHDVLAPSGFTCNGWLNPEAVTPLLSATHFLPLKQLAAILILQLWLDSIG
jgi:asparagine synthase (glutamine-hydrolysing)